MHFQTLWATSYLNLLMNFLQQHDCCLQNFSGSGYSGLVYDAPEELRDYSVKGKWRIPINMHIGNMGLAPVTGAPIITAPPMRSGGNIDNKRIGIGGKLAKHGQGLQAQRHSNCNLHATITALT